MKRCLRFLALLLVAVVAGCGTPAAIQDVLDHPDRYVNQRVSVSGVVEETVVLEVKPLDDDFHGQVLLRDKTGSITVKTRGNPPAKGTVRGFTGVLKQAKPGDIMVTAAAPTAASPATVLTVPPAVAYFLEQSPPLPIALIAALAALLVLAAVLVHLLVRQPGPAGVVCANCGRSNRAGTEVCRYCHQVVTGTVAPPPPPPPATRTCQYCQTQNDPANRFCENCGKELGETVAGGRANVATQVFGPVLGDLRLLDGDGVATSRTWDLVARKQTIGSQAGTDICISGDPTVSREHARIWCEDGNGGFCIQDLASTNGTFVNGQRVVKQLIADGDTIQVGRTRLLFRVNAPRSQP